MQRFTEFEPGLSENIQKHTQDASTYPCQTVHTQTWDMQTTCMHADLNGYAQSVSPNTHIHCCADLWSSWPEWNYWNRANTARLCVCECLWPPALTQGQVEEVLWSVKGVTLLVFLPLPILHFLFLKSSLSCSDTAVWLSISLFLSLRSSLILCLLNISFWLRSALVKPTNWWCKKWPKE